MASFDITDWWQIVAGGKETDPAAGMALGARMNENAQLMQLRHQDNQIRTLSAVSDMIKAQAAISQREAQVNGMAELSNYISMVAKSNAWDQPEARAKFWEIGAKHPSIGADVMRQMDSSTFEEAVKRKEMANRFKTQQEAAGKRIEQANRRLDIMQQNADTSAMGADDRKEIADARLDLDLAKAESNEAYRDVLLANAERRLMAAESRAKERSVVEQGNLKLREQELEARRQRHQLSMKRLEGRLPESVRMAAQKEFNALEEDWKNFHSRFKGADGKMDPEKYQVEIDSLVEKYTPTTAVEDDPNFRREYDPTTGKVRLVPVKKDE